MKKVIEFFRKKPDELEPIRKELRVKIKLARKNALTESTSTFESGRQFFRKLYNLVNKKDRVMSEFDEMVRMFRKSQSATIAVDTLTEYRLLLEEALNNKNEIFDTLEHENAHMNLSEQEKEMINLKYCLTAYKTKKGAGYFIPSVRNSRKEDEYNLDYLLASLRTLQGPDQYGHKMSQDDIFEFQRIQQLLKEYAVNAKENNLNIPETAKKIKKYDELMKENLVPNPEKSVDNQLEKIHDDLLNKYSN